MSSHRKLTHRPETIACRTCRAMVEVRSRGPLPVYCGDCSPRSSRGRAARARLASPEAEAALARAELDLAEVTEEQTTNKGLTTNARRTLARIISMLDSALPLMSPAQLAPAAKAMLEVIRILSGDSIGQDFAQLTVVIGAGSGRDDQ